MSLALDSNGIKNPYYILPNCGWDQFMLLWQPLFGNKTLGIILSCSKTSASTNTTYAKRHSCI
jgi:hypothetical protein